MLLLLVQSTGCSAAHGTRYKRRSHQAVEQVALEVDIVQVHHIYDFRG
jgi:hypothetical protein